MLYRKYPPFGVLRAIDRLKVCVAPASSRLCVCSRSSHPLASRRAAACIRHHSSRLAGWRRRSQRAQDAVGKAVRRLLRTPPQAHQGRSAQDVDQQVLAAVAAACGRVCSGECRRWSVTRAADCHPIPACACGAFSATTSTRRCSSHSACATTSARRWRSTLHSLVRQPQPWAVAGPTAAWLTLPVVRQATTRPASFSPPSSASSSSCRAWTTRTTTPCGLRRRPRRVLPARLTQCAAPLTTMQLTLYGLFIAMWAIVR